MATEEQLARRHRLNELMDIYGELLTDRQLLFMELHVAEDLSFGEIAEQHQVSRQAVHDSVKHAEMALENFEAKLHLLESRLVLDVSEEETESHQVASPASKPPGNSALAEHLGSIIAELSRSGGVIYNADDVAQRLEKIREEMTD